MSPAKNPHGMRPRLLTGFRRDQKVFHKNSGSGIALNRIVILYDASARLLISKEVPMITFGVSITTPLRSIVGDYSTERNLSVIVIIP